MSASTAGRLLWLLCCVGACGSDSSHARRPKAPPPNGAPNASEGRDAENPEAELVVALALERVTALRQLPALRPVRGRRVARAAMVDAIEAHLSSDVPPSVLEGSREVLIALGAAPPDFDYVASVLSLMTSQLAGYYEPEDETMYLAEDLEEAEREATLSHELVHALQDQHYDLESQIAYRVDASDAQSAVHSLAEGDATSAMLDDLLAEAGQTALSVPESLLGVQVRAAIELSSDTADVPAVIKRSLVAPYVDGVELVHALRRRGGWAAVDAVWKKPPATTEQVLHLDKLDAREPGETIAVPAPPAGVSAEPMYRDVYGEQTLRIVFEEWVPRRTAVDSAAGWGGDRIAVYRSGSATWVAWRVRWDTVAGARAGLHAFARGAHGGTPEGRAAADRALVDGGACVERADRGAFAVRLHDRDVVVTLGPRTIQAPSGPSPRHCDQAMQWSRAILGI